MKVAIHISSCLHTFPLPYNSYFIDLLVAANPKMEFTLIYDSQQQIPISLPDECRIIVQGPKINTFISLHFWYQYKLPRLLKQLSPDIFISTGEICCLKTNIPQVIINHDHAFIKKSMSPYLKSREEKYKKKAQWIFSSGVQIKKQNEIKLLPGFNITYNIPDHLKKNEIKNVLTSGKEYLVYLSSTPNDSNFICLLKAFSIFKKWQKTEMLLIILTSYNQDPAIADFSSYKYRDEVLCFNKNNTKYFTKIPGAAYGGITFSTLEIDEPGLLMMKAGIPVITMASEEAEFCFGKAALYSEPNENSLAQKMISLYKDESYRNDSITAGKEQAALYSWQHCADVISQHISSHK